MSRYWKLLTGRVTPAEVASRELACSELMLLDAKTSHEYAASLISYHDGKIKRLRKFLSELEAK